MWCSDILWPHDRVEHIARHGITPREVEEICFGRSLRRRVRRKGRNPVYAVFGQTSSGRYLYVLVILFPDRNLYPITARLMTIKERRYFLQWRNR